MKAGGAIELGQSNSKRASGKKKKSSTPVIRGGMNRGAAILDFILRIIAFLGTMVSAIAMATTTERLPFFTQFLQFRAEYDDLPTFTFFVVANSIVSAYLMFSMALSILHIVCSNAKKSRVVLIFFDTAMLAVLTAGASAAAAIVYFCSCSHCVLSTQRECQGKLVCHLPAIQLFLRAHLRLSHRIFHRSPRLHTLNLALSGGPLSPLSVNTFSANIFLSRTVCFRVTD